MNGPATLTTAIDAKVKNAITSLCRRRGIKRRDLIEQALIKLLEDEIDMGACRNRRNEQTVPFEKIMSKMK